MGRLHIGSYRENHRHWRRVTGGSPSRRRRRRQASPGIGPGAEQQEEAAEMHALVVQMSTDPARAEAVARHFREDVTGWARRQPGFVTGQWLASPDGRAGIGVVVFDSEDAASRAAQGPRGYSRDADRAWNVEDVAVYVQLATADV